MLILELFYREIECRARRIFILKWGIAIALLILVSFLIFSAFVWYASSASACELKGGQFVRGLCLGVQKL